jgi:nucleoid DNA-binding protein
MIEQYISDLLYKFDTVILPGFGAFVLKYKPASLDANTNQLLPPAKIVSFDASLKNNDGILANYISEIEKISFFEACSTILAFVEETTKILDSGNSFTIQKVGSFSKAAENGIIFTSDTSTNYNLETFGMGSVAAPSVKTSNIASAPPQTPSSATIPLQKKHRFPKAAIWILIIVIALGGSGVALFIIKPDFVQNLSISELLSPSDKKENSEIKPEQKVSEKHEVLKENISQDTIAADTSSQNKNVENNQAIQNTDGNFHIISASFRIKENADNYVQTLKQKGYDSKAFFLEDKGLYVVSYNSYASKAEADEALRKIQSTENANAWVLNH